MSMSTKGVVCTTCKDICFIVSQVERAIKLLVYPEWKKERLTKIADIPPLFQLPTVELTAMSYAVQIHFTIVGEKRSLWIFFRCDKDNLALAAASISLSIGAWGQSVEVMHAALDSLAMLGDCFLLANDCSDKAYEQVSLSAPHSYLEAVAVKQSRATPTFLAEWMSLHDAGQLRPGSFKDRIGLDFSEAKASLDGEFEACCAFINSKLPPTALSI
ncbi:MAG: hypothetical protein Q7U16_12350 [Agitococcus sp.]|nr:hypothetical protein [Agitococcus sp.]